MQNANPVEAVTVEEFFGTEPAMVVPKGETMTKINDMENALKLLPTNPALAAARPILAMLAARERGRAVLTTQRVARLLKDEGMPFGPMEVGAVFTQLAALGLGKLIPGRGRYPRGIHWMYNQVSVGRTALEPDAHLTLQAPFRSHHPVRRGPMGALTVVAKPGSSARIIVRRGSIEIDLPIDAPRQAVDNAVGAITKE